MELLLKRSQKQGMLGGKPQFVLDAKIKFTRAEEEAVKRHELGKELVYSSEAAQKHIDAGNQHHNQGTTVGYLRAIAAFGLASLRLNIRIGDLANGVHVECKTLQEAIAAEQAITEACNNLSAYVTTAAAFNGSEVVIPIAAPS